MESALYYTLSTIAQALAGALAVPVAFVVLWLSNADSDIRRGKSLLSMKFTPSNEAWKSLCDGGLEALDNFAASKRAVADPGWAHPSEREIYAAAYEANQKRPRITSRLYLALAFSIFTIALCFTLLPFTPVLSSYRVAAASLLFAGVVLGLVCLGLYVRLILALVREKPQ